MEAIAIAIFDHLDQDQDGVVDKLQLVTFCGDVNLNVAKVSEALDLQSNYEITRDQFLAKHHEGKLGFVVEAAVHRLALVIRNSDVVKPDPDPIADDSILIAQFKPTLDALPPNCLSRADREKLISLATEGEAWIQPLIRIGDGFKPNTRDTHAAAMKRLAHMWPHLTYVVWWLNGADDVVKYKKWEKAGEACRILVMGRPGDTEAVMAALKETDLSPEHFLMGPELPDVSSTKVRRVSSTEVRKLLRVQDDAALGEMLHPSVMTWCRENGPYQPR